MSASIDSVSSYSSVTDVTTTYGSEELGKDAFMNLLVTQLQYQDPLEPQDNSQFVAQLAQFSSLEQLTTANTSLDTLYSAIASMNNASMTNLLGQYVTAESDTFSYSGEGDVTLNYDADTDVSSATLTIKDEDGSVVYEGDLGALDAGEGSVTWDGGTTTRGQADEGQYTFSISGEDSNGDDVDVTSLIVGEVDGMSYESGSPVPSVDGVDVELSAIIQVSASPPDEGGDG